MLARYHFGEGVHINVDVERPQNGDDGGKRLLQVGQALVDAGEVVGQGGAGINLRAGRVNLGFVRNDSARRDVGNSKLPCAGDHIGDGRHGRQTKADVGEIQPGSHLVGQRINAAQNTRLPGPQAFQQALVEVIGDFCPDDGRRMNADSIFHRIGEVLCEALHLRCQRVPCVLNAALEALHQIGADARPFGRFRHQTGFQRVPLACDR